MGKSLKGKDLGKGISQRPDGRYEARAVINGERINIYNTDLAELKKEFEKRKNKLLYRRTEMMKVSDWIDYWFDNCKGPQLKNESSRRAYKRKMINTYGSEIGEMNVCDVTQMDVQIASNNLLERGYSEKTVRNALGYMSECMNSAMLNNMSSNNPCLCINIKNSNRMQARRVLTKQEQETFLKECSGRYYYEAYKILLLTGMRIGEFSALQWSDIDFENGTININKSMHTTYYDGIKDQAVGTPKTANSYRSIPFFGETKSCLLAWKKKQETSRKQLGSRWRGDDRFGDLVFTTTQGSPVTRYVLASDIKYIVKNINDKEVTKAFMERRMPVKFEGLYPHAFRHTFATRCFEKKMDPVVVQALMGHSNYATTVSYTHVLDDMKTAEVAKVGNFLT